MADPWRIGEYVAARPLYRAATFETWEGASDRAPDTPLIMTVAGTPLERDAAMRRELALVVDGVVPLLAVETVARDLDARQVMIEQHPGGVPLTELAPLSEPDAARLLIEIARAAAAAHERGLALSGLSPHTCFADRSGARIEGVAPRGLDFAARTRPDALSRPWPDAVYAAPELLDGARELEPACASFSIAAIAAFLLTGRHPFAGDSFAATVGRLLSGGPLEIEASPGFAALVRAATARDPAARPSPLEVACWLQPIADRREVDVEAELSRVELRRKIGRVIRSERSERTAAELERELPRLADLPAAGERAGRFVLAERLAGSTAAPDEPFAIPEALWRGHDPARPDEPVLIAVTSYRWGLYGDRRAALALDVPRVAPLLYLGPVIGRELGVDALVEAEPAGTPLDRIAPVGEAVAAGILAELAALLEVAAARGQVLAGLRPERVYVDGQRRLTGVAPRGEELFEMSIYSRGFWARRYPRRIAYRGRYGEPERGRDPHDWRQGLGPASDVFALAAIGHFLVTGRHLDWTRALEQAVGSPWPAPRLAALLRPALSRDPRLRPPAAALSPALAALGREES